MAKHRVILAILLTFVVILGASIGAWIVYRYLDEKRDNMFSSEEPTTASEFNDNVVESPETTGERHELSEEEKENLKPALSYLDSLFPEWQDHLIIHDLDNKDIDIQVICSNYELYMYYGHAEDVWSADFSDATRTLFSWTSLQGVITEVN